jgi:hypothetical protein
MSYRCAPDRHGSVETPLSYLYSRIRSKVCDLGAISWDGSKSALVEKGTNLATPGCQLVGGSPIVFGSYLSLLAFEICEFARL